MCNRLGVSGGVGSGGSRIHTCTHLRTRANSHERARVRAQAPAQAAKTHAHLHMRALERDSNMSGDSREPARREQRGLVVRQLPRGGGGRVHQAPPSPVLFARLRTARAGGTRLRQVREWMRVADAHHQPRVCAHTPAAAQRRFAHARAPNGISPGRPSKSSRPPHPTHRACVLGLYLRDLKCSRSRCGGAALSTLDPARSDGCMRCTWCSVPFAMWVAGNVLCFVGHSLLRGGSWRTTTFLISYVIIVNWFFFQAAASQGARFARARKRA